MPRAIWSGAISFGLVNVPVKLYSAVSKKTVRFHQLSRDTGVRIQQKRVDPSTGEEVPYDQLVKGYEIAPDRYVVIEPVELEAVEPKKTKTIDIEDFVELSDIDPIYYDHPYYLAPGPGGVANPDNLRSHDDAVKFVQGFVNAGKPIAAICHGAWTLVEADAVKGRTLTSFPSIKTDIENAGGTWVDEEVHVDQGLVTSRKPDDLPAFNAKMIEEFAEGKHEVREKAGAGAATS